MNQVLTYIQHRSVPQPVSFKKKTLVAKRKYSPATIMSEARCKERSNLKWYHNSAHRSCSLHDSFNAVAQQ